MPKGIPQVPCHDVQPVAGQFRPDAARKLDRADIRGLRWLQIIPRQETAQDAHIKGSVMGRQNTAIQMPPDSRPEGIKFRFSRYHVRCDPMNTHRFRRKDNKGRADQAVAFFHTSRIVHGHRRQRAGTVGVGVRRFKIKGSKI